MMSGLPGSGKSYVSRRLAARLDAVVVESDWVRKLLFPQPDYGPLESMITHGACRALIRRLLWAGRGAIYDATNLIEAQRQVVYELARSCHAELVIIRTVAAPQEIMRRLAARKHRPESNSDADWNVYLRLAESAEPIRRRHICVDTTKPVESWLLEVDRAFAVSRASMSVPRPTL
jgi:hypothetical protein